MKRKLITTLAGLGVAIIASLTLFVPQANATPVHDKGIGGEFCQNHGSYQFDHGKWYQCIEVENHWRWEPSGPPSSKSPEPSASASSTKSTSASPVASTSASSGGSLPVTGTNDLAIAGVGVTAIGGGIAAVLLARRRRDKVQFKA